MTSKMTTKQAIETVLSGSKKPMTVAEITDAGVAGRFIRGCLAGIAGRLDRFDDRAGNDAVEEQD